jgi:hypothetical protein
MKQNECERKQRFSCTGMHQVKCTSERKEKDTVQLPRKKTVLHVGLHSDFYGKGSCTNNVCKPLVPAAHIFCVKPSCMLSIRPHSDLLFEEMRRMTQWV